MFSSLSYTVQKRIIIVSFLFIPLLLLGMFSYYPAGNLIWLSFHAWDGISPRTEFVGLDNYIELFTDPENFSVFGVSLYYLAGAVVQMALALFFATVLSFKVRFQSFFKGVLFFPYLLNGVAISFIFLFFFTPDGTLDTILKTLGLGKLITFWMGNTDVNNICLAAVSIWRFMGYMFILFLGSIQSISADLYEAADIDGANNWHKFRYIIIPSIKNIIEINAILAIAGSLAVFDIPYIMLGGGNGTKTFVTHTVQMAFIHEQVGLASAMGVFLLVVVMVITLIQKKLFSEKEV